MIADKHTHRQTNRHAHHNTPIGIFFGAFLLHPYWGGAKMQTYSLSTGDPLSN